MSELFQMSLILVSIPFLNKKQKSLLIVFLTVSLIRYFLSVPILRPGHVIFIYCQKMMREYYYFGNVVKINIVRYFHQN